jgi:hypothetical protein
MGGDTFSGALHGPTTRRSALNTPRGGHHFSASHKSVGARHAPIKERNDGTAAFSLGYLADGIRRTGRSLATVALPDGKPDQALDGT